MTSHRALWSILRRPVVRVAILLPALLGVLVLAIHMSSRWPGRLYMLWGEHPVREYDPMSPDVRQVWHLYRTPGGAPEAFEIEGRFGLQGTDGTGALWLTLRNPMAESGVGRFLLVASGMGLRSGHYRFHGNPEHADSLDGKRWVCLEWDPEDPSRTWGEK